MLSLRYACIRSLGITLIPEASFVPNFIFVVASTAELAHGEKLHTQSTTYPTYLMRRDRSFHFGIIIMF